MRSLRLLLLAAATTAATAAAQPPAARRGPDVRPHDGRAQDDRERGPRGPRRGMGGPLTRDITLSDAQKAAIQTINRRYRQEHRALRDELRAGRTAARPAAGAPRPDSAARAAMRARREASRGRVRDLRRRQLADLRAALTPAQQATFDRNVAELRARGAERAAQPGARGGRADGPHFGRRDARRGPPHAGPR